MRASRLLVATALAALLGAPSLAAARIVYLTCRDGVPPPRTLCPVGCSRPIRCDADAQCNAVCTFAIRVCGEVACLDRIFPVSVEERQKITLVTALGAKPTKFVLRCLPHPRRIACPMPTTTTITTTTSTTLVAPPSCSSDADCQLAGNPCVAPLCLSGFNHTCECVCVSGGGLTCSPELADRCESNLDCPPVVGDPCRHCAGGLCMSNPFCV